MRSTLFFVILSILTALVAASPFIEKRAPHPSARYVPRAAQPSARYVPRAAQPSARYVARASQPSARHEARGSQPSARSPQPSAKRDVARRAINEQNPLTNANAVLCPFRMSACPVDPLPSLPKSLAEWSGIDHECVEFETDLQSCGGCASLDITYDCTTIIGAENVACMSGGCRVQTCKDSFSVSPDFKSCTPN